ncbi:hypothetical protein TKK_0002919 [Trichogramma kaykai]
MVGAGVVCCCCRNPLLNDNHVVTKASPQGRKNGARNRWKMAGKTAPVPQIMFKPPLTQSASYRSCEFFRRFLKKKFFPPSRPQ